MAARCVLSFALVFAPTHSTDVVTARPALVPADGPPALQVSTVGSVFSPLMVAPPHDWTDTALLLTFDGPAPTPTTTLPPPPILVPPTPLTLRERALNRLAELGAPQWAISAFDCIGWRESGWENKRSVTSDDGTLQINDVHDAELRASGLDPYVPEDAATFSWRLFTRAGWSFRDWTVRGLCGV